MKLSVIVPFHNSEKYIAECLRSILDQTLDDLEVILVNDKSTDNSLSIVEEYKKKDKRIHLTNNKMNLGPGLSRNVALKKARGKYIAFCDADDLYPTKDIFQKMVSAIEENDADILIGSFSEYDESKSKLITSWEKGSHLEDYKIHQNGAIVYADWQCDIGWQRCIFKKALLDKNDIRFTSLSRHEDSVFFVKALVSAKKIYGIKDIVYQYRIFHKAMDLSEKNIEDAIKGISENLIIARQHNLETLEKWCIESINWYATLSPDVKKIQERDEGQRREINRLNKQLNRKSYRAIDFILKSYYKIRKKFLR